MLSSIHEVIWAMGAYKNYFIMAPAQDDKLSFLLPDQEQDAEKSDKFSFTSFAEHFDDHINKSIRGYAELRDDIVGISRYFVENQTMVVDIGCSQGSLIRRIRDSNDHASLPP